MSAYVPKGFEPGCTVKHCGKTKKVKDWYFTTPDIPAHNCDLIVIQFTDGSDTGRRGFFDIELD